MPFFLKYSVDHELDAKDPRPSHQSVNVFNQFTQTDDSMASTVVTQRSGRLPCTCMRSMISVTYSMHDLF